MDKALMDMDIAELELLAAELNEPVFRAKQIFSWLAKGTPIDKMSNIPIKTREKLKALPYGGAEIYSRLVSRLDGTRKYLFAMRDGNIVEGVLMRYDYGNTLCVSSQVGCRMGCRFCASTLDGLVRNLAPGEIYGQAVSVDRELREEGEKGISHIVVMGSGEPMDNFENLIKFLRLANAPEGLNIGMRSISVSTCGFAERIEELARLKLGVTLSVSLHAPEDELRKSIMPIASRYPLARLMEAVKYYIEQTGRRVIFEYILLNGVNDSLKHAQALARLIKGMQYHVNLIRMNHVSERELTGSAPQTARDFKAELDRIGVSCTVRREMGQDINGACGQLRRTAVKGGNI